MCARWVGVRSVHLNVLNTEPGFPVTFPNQEKKNTDADGHEPLTAYRRKAGIPRAKSRGGRGATLPFPPGHSLLRD